MVIFNLTSIAVDLYLEPIPAQIIQCYKMQRNASAYREVQRGDNEIGLTFQGVYVTSLIIDKMPIRSKEGGDTNYNIM